MLELLPARSSQLVPVQIRTGVIRTDRKAARDDQGKKHFLGTTLFWAPQGFRTERERAQQNIDWMASEGLDYFRTLGEVDWVGREIDPAWPDYERIIGDVVDYGYSRGVRTQMTLVGGKDADHMRVTDRFANVAVSRAEKIAYIEMINEWQRLDKGDVNIMKAMARRLRARGVMNLLALSEPRASTAAERKAENSRAWPEMAEAMDAVDAHVFVEHTERNDADLGWRMVRQAYDFKNSGDANTGSNQEGPGPASSVGELTDPRRLALYAWLSWMCGAAFFTLHTGAGVTGLVDAARGRPANLWEVPRIGEILKAIRLAQRLLPEDVQNWRVVNNGGSSSPHPLRVDPHVGVGFWEGSKEGAFNKNYFALAPDGRRFVGALLGVKGFGSAETRDVLCGIAGRNLHVDAIDPVTEVVIAKDLRAGQEWILPGRKDTEAGYFVVGHFT